MKKVRERKSSQKIGPVTIGDIPKEISRDKSEGGRICFGRKDLREDWEGGFAFHVLSVILKVWFTLFLQQVS